MFAQTDKRDLHKAFEFDLVVLKHCYLHLRKMQLHPIARLCLPKREQVDAIKLIR